MKKILIATNNKDKFKIVKKILESSIMKNYEYLNLRDIDYLEEDKQEIGTIENRSRDKAIEAQNKVDSNLFEYIIGIDDGIEMKGKMIENVKEYIKDIVNDNYLLQDEIVNILRAYTFIDKNMKEKTIVTKIPFKYKRINGSIDIEKIGYPLSHVLTPLGSDITVANLSEEDSNDYYLKYSLESLNSVKSFFNNM